MSEAESMLAKRSGAVTETLEVESTEGWNEWSKGWGSFRSRVSGVEVQVVMQVGEGEAKPREGEIWEVTAHTGGLKHGVRKLWVKGEGAAAKKVGERAIKCRLAYVRSRVRAHLMRRLGVGLENEREFADLNRAILLGARRSLDRETKEMFITAGTMHVFAISGLHVMIIAGIIMAILMGMMIRRDVAGVVLLPILWAYVFLIGMTPSAVRAAAMASFYFAAPAFRRQPNGLIAWALSFIIIHLIDPMVIVQVGNVLSFVVMLGLILMSHYVKMFVNHRFDFLWMSFAAWAAGVPIAAHVFGRVTPGGILANLVLVPVATLDVAIGFVAMLVGAASLRLAALGNGVMTLITKLMYAISFVAARIPGGSIECQPWNGWEVAEWYSAVGLGLWLVKLVYERRRASLV